MYGVFIFKRKHSHTIFLMTGWLAGWLTTFHHHNHHQNNRGCCSHFCLSLSHFFYLHHQPKKSLFLGYSSSTGLRKSKRENNITFPHDFMLGSWLSFLSSFLCAMKYVYYKNYENEKKKKKEDKIGTEILHYFCHSLKNSKWCRQEGIDEMRREQQQQYSTTFNTF